MINVEYLMNDVENNTNINDKIENYYN